MKNRREFLSNSLLIPASFVAVRNNGSVIPETIVTPTIKYRVYAGSLSTYNHLIEARFRSLQQTQEYYKKYDVKIIKWSRLYYAKSKQIIAISPVEVIHSDRDYDSDTINDVVNKIADYCKQEKYDSVTSIKCTTEIVKDVPKNEWVGIFMCEIEGYKKI